MYDLVLKNGRIVNADFSIDADLAVEKGKIAAVGYGLTAKEEHDVSGKLLIPGGVDSHLHITLRLGGDLISSDDFLSGGRAAACGGTTTIMPFIHPDAGDGAERSFQKRQEEAQGHSLVDYAWHMNIGPDAFTRGREGLRNFVQTSHALGISSFKLYMAYGYRLDDAQLLMAMEEIAEVGGLPVVHAENWELLSHLVSRAVEDGHRHPRWHEKTRPASFEAEAVERVIRIAERAGTAVEIFHVGNREVVEVIQRARLCGLPVYGESCPQYLFLDRDAYERPGIEAAYAICSPPLRGKEDQEVLWSALQRGDLQIVSTDHCPFSRELKAQGLGRGFQGIPGGLPSLEMRIPSLYSEGVLSGRISENRWVAICSAIPAQLNGLEGKGRLSPGYDADIVVFDPHRTWTLRAEELHESCGWSPYEGMKLRGWVEQTYLRGALTADNGNIIGSPGAGQYLSRSQAGQL